MKNTVSPEVQEEIRRKLEEGKSNGETAVESLSDMIWSERQLNHVLLDTLEAISRATAFALDGDRSAPQKAKILVMKSSDQGLGFSK